MQSRFRQIECQKCNILVITRAPPMLSFGLLAYISGKWPSGFWLALAYMLKFLPIMLLSIAQKLPIMLNNMLILFQCDANLSG